MKGLTLVASWGVLDLRWHGKQYSYSEASRTGKIGARRITMAQVERIVEKKLVKKSLDRMSSLSGAAQK